MQSSVLQFAALLRNRKMVVNLPRLGMLMLACNLLVLDSLRSLAEQQL